MAKIPDKLTIARLAARQKMPYLTSLVMNLHPVCRPGLGTVCVDQYGRLYYDPVFLDTAPDEDLAFITLHEALHVFLRHPERLKEARGEPNGKELSGIAVDLAVNSMLVQGGLSCPQDGLMPGQYDLPEGLCCEEYYDLLQRNSKQDEPPPEQGGQQQQGQEQEGDDGGEGQDQEGEEQGQSSLQEGDEPQEGEGEGGEPSSDQADPGEDDGEGQPEPQAGGGGMAPDEEYNGPQPDRTRGEGGSSHNGQPKPWECPPPDPKADSDENPPGYDKGEQEILREQVAKAIEDYERQRGRGSVPGGLRREAKELLHPTVDPAQQLAAKVRFALTSTSGFGDFSFRRPPRRRPPGGAILPVHQQPLPQVAVVVDTSGSMDQRDLGLALGTIAKVLKRLPNPRGVRVLTGDTQVESARQVFRPDQVALVGGGGTDMRELIRAAMEERPSPNVVLVVTDGYTPWPHEPVRARVLACLTRQAVKDGVPSWIETVVLRPEED